MQNAISLGSVTEEPGRPSHTWDYAVLAAFLLSFVYILAFVATSRILRFEALAIMLLGYVLWGTIHHQRENTLTWSILLEHLGLVTFLAIVLAVLFFLV